MYMHVCTCIMHSIVQFVHHQYLFSESRFKGKHSLDSDEEDERDEVQESRLGDEDLAAQEEATIVSFCAWSHTCMSDTQCACYLQTKCCN